MSTLSPVDMLMNTNQEQINRPKPSEKEGKKEGCERGVESLDECGAKEGREREREKGERFEHRKG
jgi:hypothetical protein